MISKRYPVLFWTGFCVIVALLAVAPLVLPEFWKRFLTEILIWGLLAMSSDILIGYTGLVSFGHSAFFGLGMYCAAAALLMFKPESLWLAMAFGLVGAAAVAVFVAYFSTRLRDIYFAITTLIFSQIFYVVIFTWTELTGGENGLTFRRPRLSIPGVYEQPFSPETLHWFVLAIVALSYLVLRRITQSPFGMVLQSIRENEPRTRAIGYAVERYKIVAVMLSGLFAGLAGVLYAIQNRFAAPDFVYFLISGEVVIFNVIGGIGTLVGPIVGAGFFLLLREGFSRYPQVAHFLPPGHLLMAAGVFAVLAVALPGRRLSLSRYWMIGAAAFLVLCHVYPSLPEFYLIPVGLIFIAIVIFLPQGILGFARRWLNK
jgi:branched-chain amino acid transport system permease protein